MFNSAAPQGKSISINSARCDTKPQFDFLFLALSAGFHVSTFQNKKHTYCAWLNLYTPGIKVLYEYFYLLLESQPSLLKSRSQSQIKPSEQVKYDIKSFYQEAYSNHFHVQICHYHLHVDYWKLVCFHSLENRRNWAVKKKFRVYSIVVWHWVDFFDASNK